MRTRSEKKMAALGTCEQGRGMRELCKASNDKNTTQHHNQVSARVIEGQKTNEHEGNETTAGRVGKGIGGSKAPLQSVVFRDVAFSASLAPALLLRICIHGRLVWSRGATPLR